MDILRKVDHINPIKGLEKGLSDYPSLIIGKEDRYWLHDGSVYWTDKNEEVKEKETDLVNI